MEPLPGNREVQQEFVQKYITNWGDSIDRMNHPMSGILPVSETAGIDSDGFLPSHLKVQICHGQHRKLVMEEKIRTSLITEKMLKMGKN